MSSYLFNLKGLGKTKLSLAGGKGANLGELLSIAGIRVPEGFCISAEAYKNALAGSSGAQELIRQLSPLKSDDHAKIRELSELIRNAIEATAFPSDIHQEITAFLAEQDEQVAYAVRSSATAEDLPTASFAGQQDTFLNVIGVDAILKHIRKCWASLFTERAVTYRIQNGFDHFQVRIAVIVQTMVFPEAAGIMFTADPVTGNRKVISIDAGFGLGEAMVSGLVNADNYRVKEDEITDTKVSLKNLIIEPTEGGGTVKRNIRPERQHDQVLSAGQIIKLAQLGRKIEKHFGQPQDIEWCLAGGEFFVVQSRPVTTLFPVPKSSDDRNRVYVSVGHQQMMTHAMRPLGLSLFQAGHMSEAAGRLFVDVTVQLSTPAGRQTLLNIMGQHDPLIVDALRTIIKRDFIKLVPDDADAANAPKSHFNSPEPATSDIAIVEELIRKREASVEALRENIREKSGIELFNFILEDIRLSRGQMFVPESMGVIMAAINAAAWLNEKMAQWLGEKNAADTLAQSVPNNVTSEMGLALLHVADAVRPYPEVIGYLHRVKDENFLNDLHQFTGGHEARQAIDSFLRKYGMRCSGEIDITRTRWSEQPTALIPLILGNIRNFAPGEGYRKFEQGLKEARDKEAELLKRLMTLPDGEQKATEAEQKIRQLRNFMGYREYPKYTMMNRYFIYKTALMEEAKKLVTSGAIHEIEDSYYLTFEEFRNVVDTGKVDYAMIDERKEEHVLNERLTPPRVITSDGEIVTGEYNRENIPAGAIVGLAVSSGAVEGRARVILRMEDANLEDGDILVTSFTDPSWTPLFVSIKGLVAEVGGLMTHGAVVAREYGLPAVVGVENATKLIKDGQRIRVHGTEGYVEILATPNEAAFQEAAS